MATRLPALGMHITGIQKFLVDEYPLTGIRDHRKIVHGVQSRRFRPVGVASVGTAAVLRRA